MSSRASLELYCPACDRPFSDGTEQCPNDGTRLVRITEDPLVGREIDGRFELRERIGAGGMGAVYRGWQRSVGREVAVKVIRSHQSAGAFEIKRFMREAQLTSRLVHPNVVSVIDFGQTTDGLLYLAMELLPGLPLSQVWAGTPGRRFSPERAVDIGVQLCDALQVAHDAQIIHRDLKPSNIMVLDGPGDRVKVLDFGLARPLAGDHSTLTASDLLLGTPGYMSPEMVQNEPLDSRSDLYSLGVVLYQLLAGRLPFGGGRRAAVMAQLDESAQPLPDDVPRPLANVVMRLLERDPGRRYPSAATTREALSAARSWSGPTPAGDERPQRSDLPSTERPTAAAKVQKGVESGSLTRPSRFWWIALALVVVGAGTGWVVLGKKEPAAAPPPIASQIPLDLKAANDLATNDLALLPAKTEMAAPAPVANQPRAPDKRRRAKPRKNAEDYILPH
jgi:serine/threonine-protein kinase